MNSFDQAVSVVHDALSAMRANASGPLPRAARAALERLAATPKAAGAPEPAPEPEPPSTPQPKIQPAPIPARAEAPAKPAAPAPVSEPSQSRAERLEALRQRFAECGKCPNLVGTRTHVVFGVGNPEARLMFVGEAPGADEDREGEPFVGRAGQLLTKIIQAMGFERGDVYIANILKCRPDMPPGETGNRKPRPDEMATCLPYLIEQIEIIRPECLVALGATAMEGLLGEPAVMRQVRGRWHKFRDIPLMATYHPAYLLRNQSMAEKRKVWEDMLQVLEKLGDPISLKQRGYFLPK
ncbi:MAG: uracil-DNA glycosylase family protein [Chthoniobacteraceae bacterium]